MRQLLNNLVIGGVLLLSSAALADAARFSWPRPANSLNHYTVEIASDPEFKKIAFRGKATKTEYYWTKAKIGVWHWRVREDRDKKAFCHGSFGMIAANDTTNSPYLQIKWRLSDGDEKVALQYTEVGKVGVLGHLKSNRGYIARPGQNKQIVVGRLVSGVKALRAMDTSFWPNLTITSSDKLAKAEKALLLGDSNGADPIITKKSAPPARIGELANSRALPAKERLTKISISGVLGEYSFKGNKKELALTAKVMGGGGIMQIQHKLRPWFAAEMSFEGHKLAGEVPVSGAQEGEFLIDSEMIRASMGGHFGLVRSQSFHLGLGAHIGYALEPGMTTSFDGLSASIPSLEQNAYRLAGGGVATSWQGSRFSLNYAGRVMQGLTKDIHRQTHLLKLNLNLFAATQISAGLHYAKSSLQACAADKAICASEGESKLKVAEILASLGLSYSL